MNALQQVTARDGRPIIVCEKGDTETASYAYKTIEVPPTVDCLQVRHKLQYLLDLNRRPVPCLLFALNMITTLKIFFTGDSNSDSNAASLLPHSCLERMQC